MSVHWDPPSGWSCLRRGRTSRCPPTSRWSSERRRRGRWAWGWWQRTWSTPRLTRVSGRGSPARGRCLKRKSLWLGVTPVILDHTRYCNNELITCGGWSCPGTLLISPDDPPTSSALVRPVPAVPQTALIRILTRQRRTRRRGCGRRGRRAQPGVVDRVSSEELVVVVKLLVPRSPTVVVSKLKELNHLMLVVPQSKSNLQRKQLMLWNDKSCITNAGNALKATERLFVLNANHAARVPSLSLS